jgi:hypothetical protein
MIRENPRGSLLKNVLFRLVVAEGIHLKKNQKGTPDIWETFSILLFKQPEFVGLEGSANSIYNTETLNKRARHHGWKDENGGVTGNLSGYEGDLDELNANVRQILMDKEDKRANAELKKIQTGELNDIEKDVLTSRLQEQAREKRKYGAGKKVNASPSSTISTTSSVSSVSVDDVFSSIFGPSSAAKKARRDDVEDVGDKLYQRFQQSGLTFNNVVVEAGLSDEGEGVLFVAGLEIAFSVFSTPDSFGCVNY